MSGKNRTSPEKIGPLVHLDMSGKYQTSPDLVTHIPNRMTSSNLVTCYHLLDENCSIYSQNDEVTKWWSHQNKHTSTVRCLWPVMVSGFRVLQAIIYLLKSYIRETSKAHQWLPKLTHSFVVHFDFRLSSSYRLFREINKNNRSKKLLTTNLLCLHQRRPLRRTREDAPVTIKAGQSLTEFGTHEPRLFIYLFIYYYLFIYSLSIYHLFIIIYLFIIIIYLFIQLII